MATVKGAFSIDKDLFEEVDAVAHTMNVPRSQLIALALKEYLRRYKAQALLDNYNQVYSGEPDPDETKAVDAAFRYFQAEVEDTW